MDKIKIFLKPDSKYKSLIDSYHVFDGVVAIVYYLFLLVAYYILGVILEKKDVYLGYHVNIILIILLLLCVVIRKQKFESIGFGKDNIKKSFRLGLVTAGLVFFMSFIPGVLSGKTLNSVSELLSNFVYYLFVIALVEEIIFRGFIQTRIYGMIKKPALAILVVAFMFMTMHIPFQMARAEMGVVTFITNNYITLIFQFSWHVVFNIMYAKYNSIIAPTIFHTILNWSNYLFVR